MKKLYEKLREEGVDPYKYKLDYLGKLETVMEKILEEREILAKENKELKAKLDALDSSIKLKDEMEDTYKKIKAALGGNCL